MFDRFGNLIVCEGGKIKRVINDMVRPNGKFLRRIAVPEIPANVCFGKEGETLFITARTSLYAIKLN